MPAKLIETNTEAFATTEVDPVTLDIIENALRNARVEMDATLFRTALSPSIREQGDAFPGLTTVRSKKATSSCSAIPIVAKAL
jgi:N-methylhydantoinase B